MPRLSQVSSPIGNLIGAANRGITPILDEYFQKRKQQRTLDEFFNSEEGKQFSPEDKGIFTGISKGVIPKEAGLQYLKQKQGAAEQQKATEYFKNFPKQGTAEEKIAFIQDAPISESNKNSLLSAYLKLEKPNIEKKTQEAKREEEVAATEEYIKNNPELTENQKRTIRGIAKGAVPATLGKQFYEDELDSKKAEKKNTFLGEIKGKSLEEIPKEKLLEGLVEGWLPPSFVQDVFKLDRPLDATKEKELSQKLYQDEYKNARKQGESSRNKLAVLRRQSDLVGTKSFGPLGWDNLLRKLGFAGATSPEAQQLLASNLQYMEGEKDRFGTRLSDADLKYIQNKMPDISRTEEGNRAILQLFESEAKFNELKSQAYDNILKKNKGFTFDFGEKVNDELDRLLNENPDVANYYRTSLDELNKLAKEAPEEKQFEFESLPSASEYSGKTIEDDKGNRYKSNGKKWSKI